LALNPGENVEAGKQIKTEEKKINKKGQRSACGERPGYRLPDPVELRIEVFPGLEKK